jgi:hypothetical protein
MISIAKTEPTQDKNLKRLKLMPPLRQEPGKEVAMGMMPPIPLMMGPMDSEYFGKDENCGGYNMVKSCIFCYNSYFNPKVNKCTIPLQKLENCLFYLDEEYCINCELGYRMDLRQRQCIKNTVPNCKTEFEGECKVKRIFIKFYIYVYFSKNP